MDRKSSTPRPTRAELNDRETADNVLIAWDELDEQLLQMLAEDPERGRRLRKLQDADGWLRARATEAALKKGGPALLECPSSEELYDFGQGPGATGLSQARHDAIDRHLATCRECESLVETLTVPPVPELILGLPEEDAESEQAIPTWTRPTPIHPIRRKGPQRLLVGAGLAAAAALVAMIAIQSQSAPEMDFPIHKVRGVAGEAILFPRGRVLLPSDEVLKVFPALYGPLEWQVAPVAGASEYKLEISLHEDSAFAGPGTPMSPPITAPHASGKWSGTLVEGEYTVSARALVHGLPEKLGEHDFHAQTDSRLERQLIALKDEPEPKRTLAAITLLDEAKYWNEARALARTLPATHKRDDYLSQIPGG